MGMGVEGCLPEHTCTGLPAVAAWRKMSLSVLEMCPCLMKELSSWGLHKACGARPASQLLPVFTFPPCVPSAAFQSIMTLLLGLIQSGIALMFPCSSVPSASLCSQPVTFVLSPPDSSPGSPLLLSPMEEQNIFSLNVFGENSPNKSW